MKPIVAWFAVLVLGCLEQPVRIGDPYRLYGPVAYRGNDGGVTELILLEPDKAYIERIKYGVPVSSKLRFNRFTRDSLTIGDCRLALGAQIIADPRACLVKGVTKYTEVPQVPEWP